MGRVSRYKKVKAFDPFSKQNAGRLNLDHVGIWGLGDDGRKPKKKSQTALKLKAQRQSAKRKQQEKLLQQKQGSNSFNKNKTKDVFFDFPPNQLEDEFDLDDMTGSLKKEKDPLQDLLEPVEVDAKKKTKNEDRVVIKTPANNPNPSSLLLSSSSSDDDAQIDAPKAQHISEQEERELHKLLQLDMSHTGGDDKNNNNPTQQQQFSSSWKQKTNDLVKSMGRLEGEGKSAYRRRVHQEMQKLIQKERKETRNPERVAKKKEFLQQRKRKKRKRGRAISGDLVEDDDDDDTDDAVGVGGSSSSAVRFGEQAERPPTFRQLPRGAKKNKKNDNDIQNDGSTKKKEKKKAKRRLNSEADVQQEQEVMERMRQKVQAQYKLQTTIQWWRGWSNCRLSFITIGFFVLRSTPHGFFRFVYCCVCIIYAMTTRDNNKKNGIVHSRMLLSVVGRLALIPRSVVLTINMMGINDGGVCCCLLDVCEGGLWWVCCCSPTDRQCPNTSVTSAS